MLPPFFNERPYSEYSVGSAQDPTYSRPSPSEVNEVDLVDFGVFCRRFRDAVTRHLDSPQFKRRRLIQLFQQEGHFSRVGFAGKFISDFPPVVGMVEHEIFHTRKFSQTGIR